jgi:hypothetical protein
MRRDEELDMDILAFYVYIQSKRPPSSFYTRREESG